MRLRRARGRRGQNRARRGHAVQQRENLQLRLQFIGDAIDRQIDLADGVLDGRDKGHVGQSFRADLLAQGFAGMMQVAGLGITSFSSTRQPARTAFRASQLHGRPAPTMATVGNARLPGGQAWATSSALGLACCRHSATRALLVGERGDGGQHPVRGDGIFVNVVHQTDGFSGQSLD